MVPMVHCTNKLIIVILLYYDPDYLGTILLPLGTSTSNKKARQHIAVLTLIRLVYFVL